MLTYASMAVELDRFGRHDGDWVDCSVDCSRWCQFDVFDFNVRKGAPNNKYAKLLLYITATGDATIDDMADLQHTARGRTHFQSIGPRNVWVPR